MCCPSSVRSSGREGEGRGGGREGGTFDDDQEFRCIDTLIKYLEINDLLLLSSMQNLPALYLRTCVYTAGSIRVK